MSESMTFDAAAFTSQGTKRESVTLPPTLFDGTVNMPVMHQAVKAYLANQRQGNASTKTRGLVVGGNQKPWKQKGTGRARQGSIRAPNWPGGGTVFGPLPRAYDQYVPRQVRALARKSAFNARAREHAIYIIDAFTYDAPKTSRLFDLLVRLDVADKNVLILTHGVKPNVYLSGRNLPDVHVMPYTDVSTYLLLWSDVVLVESEAMGFAMAPIAEKEPAERPKAKKREAARGKEEGEEKPRKAKARAASKPSKKPAAKKPAAKAKAAPKAAARKPAAKKPAAKPKKKGK